MAQAKPDPLSDLAGGSIQASDVCTYWLQFEARPIFPLHIGWLIAMCLESQEFKQLQPFIMGKVNDLLSFFIIKMYIYRKK